MYRRGTIGSDVGAVEATIVGFILTPLAEAAPILDDLARRLDIPIGAVPLMITPIQVVEINR
jgi:hypothetical protein